MITVILCAAGSGSRTGFAENKILHELNGLPVLCYSLSAFASVADEILVACRREDEEKIKDLLSPYPAAHTVIGGETRMESVYNALKQATGEIVLIHDAARPFVTHKIIEDCIESVKKYGSGICALPSTDTVVLCDNDKIHTHPARTACYTVQTPQGFYTEKLLSAYQKAFAEGRHDFTDDSGIYGEFCDPCRIFIGERSNTKLTFAEDFAPAQRVGFGVDTHAFFIPEDFHKGIMRLNLNYIVLGGVVIPSKFSLIAHSDGDVLVHALMDALLSAIGKRDIGYYFPDTDPQFKGIRSMKLLDEVMKIVHGCGFSLKNASISVLAETPRLAPYIEEIQKNLSSALDCENVALAAGTNEKLGYVGEGKGITVYATVLLK